MVCYLKPILSDYFVVSFNYFVYPLSIKYGAPELLKNSTYTEFFFFFSLCGQDDFLIGIIVM